MNQWVINLQEGKTVRRYFEERKYHNIAVYGKSYLSERLCKEIENTDIAVKLIFDKDSIESDLLNSLNLDVIVVTSLYYYYDIYLNLKKYTNVKVICLDEIIYKTYEI